MSENRMGWHWFDDKVGAPEADGRQIETEKSFARCFAGDDGERVLQTLRAMTIERMAGPEVSDSALRHLEGQRYLVAVIAALIRRGRESSPSSNGENE